MYIGVLIHQEYPSEVYQPGTTSLEPKVILIQIYFDISYSLFPHQIIWLWNSSSLLALLLLTSLFWITPSPLTPNFLEHLQHSPSLTTFLWITTAKYMRYPLTTSISIFLKQLYNFSGTKKTCSILLCQDHPHSKTSLYYHLPWGTPHPIWPGVYYTVTFHSP